MFEKSEHLIFLPLNYIGGKKKILDKIPPLFPKEIKRLTGIKMQVQRF